MDIAIDDLELAFNIGCFGPSRWLVENIGHCCFSLITVTLANAEKSPVDCPHTCGSPGSLESPLESGNHRRIASADSRWKRGACDRSRSGPRAAPDPVVWVARRRAAS